MLSVDIYRAVDREMFVFSTEAIRSRRDVDDGLLATRRRGDRRIDSRGGSNGPAAGPAATSNSLTEIFTYNMGSSDQKAALKSMENQLDRSLAPQLRAQLK